MTQIVDVRQEILDAANRKAEPGTPVSLLEIGPVLVLEKNYTELEVVDALYALQEQKVIELLDGNRMRVL
ncbi:hypothetical protein QO004_000439 [Rhizobium mesoamericanum]|uniref:hypothetical protein n=1 Tax=Rhizobium mesoamericanum TaxID=1079800 RepID=UPI002787209F|nr:hypothetical protein [Rhizobium mesoamericanum]MDQ0558664.1 hypothetical protein [Rhizobium mesoamericanum]